MKNTAVILLLAGVLIACKQENDNSSQIKSQIGELEKKIVETYKPGFADFMSNIQVRHAKLYFAGENKNWKLADFEVQKIKELLKEIPKYCAEREETQFLQMIQPAIDSIDKAIARKSITQFKSNFVLLTNTCNNCHRATNREFNVVKIPETPPFSNQDFKNNNLK